LDDSTVELLAILVLVATLFVLAVLSRRRRQAFPLRRIPAYEQMPALVGRSIEADRPLHMSIGSAGIGGASTVVAVAGAELAYLLAQRAAIGDTSPILSLSSGSALPLAQDALRRAYQARGYGDRYAPTAARWYPSGRRSLAFAAAITAMMRHEDVSGNVLAGSFGPELGLIMVSAQRQKLPVLAVSDQIEGQAVAYALGDAPLIGEELFAAPSYLDDDPNQSTRSVVTDVLRWGLILVMLAGLIATIGG
jgi:hypothetical protein